MRAIEVRPSTVKGRKITHHANADILQFDPDAPAAEMTPGRFSEWAVGKEAELMRPDSGALMLPGSKIAWDIHYSNGGEDITDVVELGIYFYPKGQQPEVPAAPDPDGQDRCGRAGHPAEHRSS